jgi:hypothetical protein
MSKLFGIVKTRFMEIREKAEWVENLVIEFEVYKTNKQNKLRGQSLRANYTDRATAACRQS